MTDGLSRTDRSLLAPLRQKACSAPDLFRAHMAAEDRPFLGDVWAIGHLDALATEERPLVTNWGHHYALTDDGRAVLTGDLDAVELRGLDRWLGGTHLTPRAQWRWDPETGRVTGT